MLHIHEKHPEQLQALNPGYKTKNQLKKGWRSAARRKLDKFNYLLKLLQRLADIGEKTSIFISLLSV